MRIIIHTGMHKTGMTSLQGLMSGSSEILLKHGIYYPAGGHAVHRGCMAVMDPAWNPQAMQQQIDVARHQGAEILMLSSESISTYSVQWHGGGLDGSGPE